MIETIAFWYVNYMEPFSTILLFVLFVLGVLWLFFLLQDVSRLSSLVTGIFKGLGAAIMIGGKLLLKSFSMVFGTGKRLITVFFATIRDFFTSKV